MEFYDPLTGRLCIDQIRELGATEARWRAHCERLVFALERLQAVEPEMRIASGFFSRRPPALCLVSGKETSIDLSVDADDFGPDPLSEWHWRLSVKRPRSKLTLDLRPASTEEAAAEILRWLGIRRRRGDS